MATALSLVSEEIRIEISPDDKMKVLGGKSNTKEDSGSLLPPTLSSSHIESLVVYCAYDFS